MNHEALYECKHCRKKFYSERVFIKHECTQMLRTHEIQTIQGQMAYGMYKVWLEKQRRKPPPPEGFVTSAYYTSFMKFASWVRETGIPDPEKYIDLMVDSKIAPALWRRSEAYQIFLEYTDKRSDPYEQVNVSIETILALSEGLEIKPAEVFKRFTSAEITELIQQRRLSPWLMFCSKSFKQWIESLVEGERRELMKNIGIGFWSNKLERSPEVVKQIKLIAEELGI